MKYLFKKFPGRHAVVLLTAVIIVVVVGGLDRLLMSDFAYVDFLWLIPIGFAALFLAPLETVAIALASSMLCLFSLMGLREDLNFVTPILIGSSGILAGILAALVKRNIKRLESVRDAVEISPLAYAEFKFPGYMLTNYNQAFADFSNISVAPGEKRFLDNCFREETASRITKFMDAAATTGTQTECEEFHIATLEGKDTFW